MFEKVDPERMDYFCRKIIENDKILESNGKLWSTPLDLQLKEFVILYNFNFYEVANRFHSFMSEKRKYEFTEDAIRRHWAFIHAARYLNLSIDEDYYDSLRAKYRVEEIKQRKQNLEEEKLIKAEEERIRRDIEKMKCERFNLITLGDEQKQIKEKLEEKDNFISEENFKEELHSNLPTSNNENPSSQLDIIPSEVIHPSFDFEYDETINNLFKNSKDKVISNTQQEINPQIPNEIVNDSYDHTLFPINTGQNLCRSLESNDDMIKTPQDNDSSFRQNTVRNSINDDIDKEIEKTKNIDDFINDDIKLKEQYENLNTYYNFAVKSLNYFIPKLGQQKKNEGEGNENPNENKQELIDDLVTDQFEEKVIKKTSEKINSLFLNSMKEASEKLAKMGEEECNKKLNLEEVNMEAEILNKHNTIASLNVVEPLEKDQEEKLTKFRNYLFTEATKVSTPELLSRIVDIINTTYIDEVKVRNDGEEEKDTEDQSEVMSITNINQNAIPEDNEIDNQFPKKTYKYFYRGVEYYSDKPPKENNSDDSFVGD